MRFRKAVSRLYEHVLLTRRDLGSFAENSEP